MISIIITAYKEERTIGKAIQSFLDNKLVDYEILVFAPDKQTLDVVEKFSKKNKKIKAIKDKGKGKPTALNQAFKLAKGEILILSDGDVYVKNNAVREILKPFPDNKIGAVSGHPISINSRKNKFGYWSHLLTDIINQRRIKALKIKKRIYCSGYLYAIRNNIIDKIPENTLSDDAFVSHLIYSKGYKISYSEKAEVYVKYPNNLKDWINQKKRSAGGYNQIKLWTKKELRSFSKESSGVFEVLKYSKSFKEFLWTIQLIFVRFWLWILIFKDINLNKKDFEKIWVRIESTK